MMVLMGQTYSDAFNINTTTDVRTTAKKAPSVSTTTADKTCSMHFLIHSMSQCGIPILNNLSAIQANPGQLVVYPVPLLFATLLLRKLGSFLIRL